MKTLSVLAIVAIVLLASVAIPLARSAGAPDRPPSVTQEAWVAIGDTAGFAIAGNSLSSGPGVMRDPTVLLPQPALRGTFYVKRGAVWWRVETLPDPRLEPAGQTR